VSVRTKRVYDAPAKDDGRRVLADRLWPRGISKQRAQVDEWARELAPSDELRKWFAHDPKRFAEFRDRYRKELAEHSDRVDELRSCARKQALTIVYGAKDEQHNNAVVLAELLRG
jgi:uncharacterized protein YeaO (DUF488 family)